MHMTQSNEGGYLNSEEAGSILGVSRRTVERYAQKGKLTRYRQGRRVIFRKEEVERLNEEINQPHPEVKQ